MPIPKPRKGEKQDEFIPRCMGDGVMKREYPDQKQRAGVCYSQWRQTHGERAMLDGLIAELAKVGTSIHTLVFDKKKFKTAAAAAKWAKDNGYSTETPEESEQSWRLKQEPSGHFDPDSFRTIELPNTNGVKAIIGKLKPAYRAEREAAMEVNVEKTKAREFLKMHVQFISLIFDPKRPANMEPVLLRAEGYDNKPDFQIEAPITRYEANKGVAYCMVYAPYQVDTEKTFAKEQVIREAMDTFMRERRTCNVDKNHDYNPETDRWICESWQVDPGDPKFTAAKYVGGWAIGVHLNKEDRELADKGKLMGVSLAGKALLGPEVELPDQEQRAAAERALEERGAYAEVKVRDALMEKLSALHRAIIELTPGGDAISAPTASIFSPEKRAAVVAAIQEFVKDVQKTLGEGEAEEKELAREGRVFSGKNLASLKKIRTELEGLLGQMNGVLDERADGTGTEGGTEMDMAAVLRAVLESAEIKGLMEKVAAHETALAGAAQKAALEAQGTALTGTITEKVTALKTELETAIGALKTSVEKLTPPDPAAEKAALEAQRAEAVKELETQKAATKATEAKVVELQKRLEAVEKVRTPSRQGEGDPGKGAGAGGAGEPKKVTFARVFGGRCG